VTALASPVLVTGPAAGHGERSLRRQRELAARGAVLLTGLLFAALIIGDRPFAPDTADKAAIAESGNSFNRAVIFVALAAACPMILLNLDRAARLLLRNWPVGALLLVSGLSFIWASHPDLVLRRAFAYGLVYLVLLALAASARSALDWLVPLAAVFGLVTVLNILAMVAFPASSWSEIGETGIFDNKNGAGTMAMLAIVVLGTAIAAGRSSLLRLVLAGLMALAWAFLLATRSKTSIGVAALIMLAGPALYFLLGSPPAMRLAALATGVAALAFGTTAFYAAGHDDADLRLLLFGDLTFTGRTEIWQAIVPEIGRRPWLGHGFGSFWDTGAAINPIRSAPPSAWFMKAQLINTAHNGYLDLLVQTGIVGFMLGVIAILRCLWTLTVTAAQVTAAERVALTGALCVAFCLVLNNFLESYLFRTGDTLGYLFIFLMLHGEAARLRSPAA
jgi:exopolysaccharide production protein ExoQ